MSTLWTPSGEHPVPKKPSDGGTEVGARARRPSPDLRGGAAGTGAGGEGDSQAPDGSWEPTPEEIREAQAEMDNVREQLVRAPVELVISNHAMGLWELAALHLSQKPPHLPQAQLAIDALSALVDGLAGRLGEAERTLQDGLSEIRMAFVQITNAERARRPGGHGD